METKKSNDAVIIYVSLILFLLRLYACRYVPPLYSGMDYYGYIELARNIFHKLDFTVRWEFDSPIQYPPFFSILIYLLTYLTKNFVTSIQYINIFCASFYLVPLFYLVRNILNVYSAILAVVFATYYFGIQPCYVLNMDFFYSFLIIIICWLIWDTLTHRSRQAGRYILAGVLISVAYLTKYSGMLFGLASIASILYYFAWYQQSLKTGFKYCAILILGIAPLFITYHLLLSNNLKKETPSIAAYAFFDGNYMYENGLDYREEKMSGLNPAGTEFSHRDILMATNEFKFSLKHPLFVFKKYIWGLNKITQDMTFSVLPGGNIAKSEFYNIKPDGDKIYYLLMRNGLDGILKEVSLTEVRINRDCYLKADTVRKAVGGDFNKVWNILKQSRNSRMIINVIFQGTFLFLLVVSGAYFKWPFNMMHILFFAVGFVFIPFYLDLARYLMPFMPLYFVLWLFILNAGYDVIQTEIKDKVFLRNAVFVISLSFVFVYFTTSCKQIEQSRLYFSYDTVKDETWLQVASWIKKDSLNLPRRAKIMSTDNYASYLTDSDYIRLPFVISNWSKVINFALLKKVNYILIEGDHSGSFFKFSEDEFRKPVTPEALISAIKAGSTSVNKAVIPATDTPIDSLNKLLEYRELYQIMPLRPVGSVMFIHRLKEGDDLTLLEIKQLNRLLIEANYPKDAPHKLWMDPNANTGSGRIKMIHEIDGSNTIFWIFKI